MNSVVKNNYLNLVITFCVVILLCVVISFKDKIAIDGDAKDYYAYLTSLFIDHNFTHQVGNDWFLLQTPTGVINVHTIGVSILLAPFFLCAFVFSKMFGYAVDGYSLPFQMGAYFAGIFYCTIGLIFLKKLLLQLNVKPNHVAALIILCCFGTHLFSYTVNEPVMAHVYAFALTSAFFYFTLNLFQKRKAKYFYLSAVALGLIILVRPVNIILISFIPFFFQNRYDLFSTSKVIVRSKHFYFAIITLLLVCSIQSFAWYQQNGRLLQDSYEGNGFYFSNPHVLKMLFGFNNGLFIYVPLCLLLLFGVIPMFAVNKFKGFVFAFSLAFIFYIFGSYWAYNYFDGIGIRTMVDFIPLFMIAGVYLLQVTAPKIKYAVATVALLFLFMNLFHIYQYRSGIIKGSGMNFDKYSYIFLKTNRAYADSLGGSNDLPLYSKAKGTLIFEQNKSFANKRTEADSVCDLTAIEYGAGYSYTIQKRSNIFFIVAEFERKEISRNSSYNAAMGISAADAQNKNKIYSIFKLNETPAGSKCDWKKYEYSIAVTGKFKKDDNLSLFIWNREKSPFYIKNFNIKIFDYSYNI